MRSREIGTRTGWTCRHSPCSWSHTTDTARAVAEVRVVKLKMEIALFNCVLWSVA